jgi:phenylalanyl-tRNA synthetase alpha chain
MEFTPENLIEQLNVLKETATAELTSTATTTDLEAWRVTYLGRGEGLLPKAIKILPLIPHEDRKATGGFANKVKTLLESKYSQQSMVIQNESSIKNNRQDSIDISLPGRPVRKGRLHPTTQIIREVCSAFESMGFQTLEGPEVEWELFNFGLLNIPKDHPARDMWNTIWIDRMTDNLDDRGGMLLRTHTSPMQARTMLKVQPPIRVVVPGRCYRYEATDATHEWHFFQIEGLVVDEGITFSDLKGTLYEFARQIFGSKRKVRFRCDYFPFVEPGVEMAIDCFACDGRGCRICKHTGWIEIMGAGMVHPKVLEMVGYDPNRYTGFAFGLGAERIAMLKYGIDDIRFFYDNDLRFLKQF